MKIARYEIDGAARTGVVVDGEIIDLDGLLAGEEPADALGVLSGGKELWRRLDEAAAQQSGRSLDAVRLLAPLERPAKFLAVGMNSPEHAQELLDAPRSPEIVAVLEASAHLKAAFPDPRFPTIFNKQTSSVAGPFDPIWMPSDSVKVDYEGEVALVIGARIRRADERTAAAAIAGFTVTNDVSVRDWQWETSQMWLGKSFDTHGPIGPWIVTADEFDADAAVIRTWVNDELRQEGRLGDQILSAAKIVSLVSQVCSLEPGDLIATGTPGGIGAIDGRYLTIGDRVRVDVTGIGEICNEVEAEPVSADSALGCRVTAA